MDNGDSLHILVSLFDKNSFTPLFNSDNPQSVYAGFGSVYGKEVYAFCQNNSFKSGAVDKFCVLKINKLYDLALKTGRPIIGIYNSNGAKIDEGFGTLNAYNSWISKANNLSGVVPQISVVLGKCAGSLAVIAASADFLILKEDAEFYLNSPFLTGDKNTDASYVLKEGLCHRICETDRDAVQFARRLTKYLPKNNLEQQNVYSFNPPKTLATYDLEGGDLVRAVADDGSDLELQQGYGENISIFFGGICGINVAFIATKSISVDIDSAAKASGFIRFCDCFSIPVITLINSKGFEKESNLSSLKPISSLTHSYFEATCPKICIVVGDICGGVYLSFASKGSANDFTFCYDNASVSAIPIEAYVELLGDDVKDKEKAVYEYKQTQASPESALSEGIIDGIIKPSELRRVIHSALVVLKDKRVKTNPKKHSSIIF